MKSCKLSKRYFISLEAFCAAEFDQKFSGRQSSNQQHSEHVKSVPEPLDNLTNILLNDIFKLPVIKELTEHGYLELRNMGTYNYGTWVLITTEHG